MQSSSGEFTARDLNRHLAKVLDACNRLGMVRIRCRNGLVYSLASEGAGKAKKPEFPDFAARAKALGMPKMTKAQSKLHDRLIRGE